MKTHTMHFAQTPFWSIKEGSKEIESRVYDAKRRSIAVGDAIACVSHETGEKVRVRVVALHVHGSFQELFSNFPPELFGQQSIDACMAQIRQFYTEEEERRDGVVGIQFECIT
jgi:ASC-1-like (ASCH) protein